METNLYGKITIYENYIVQFYHSKEETKFAMTNKIKVLFVASGDYKYGAPKSMFELILELKANYNIEPVLLTKKHNPMNTECDRLGIENYSYWSRDIMAGSAYKNPILNIMKQCVKYFLYIWGGLTQSSIKRIGINFSEIDIIHTNLNRNDIGVYIAKKYNIPHIWHLREYGNKTYKVRAYRPNVAGYMNHNAKLFIAISRAVKNVWAERGLDADKIRVVYNGLDTSVFQEKKIRDDRKIKIVMTGHIQPTKGQDQLIQAIGFLPDAVKNNVQVDLYGEAYKDYEKYLKKEIERLHIQHIVHFKGYCDNVPAKLSEYDIGIVCSKAEGFGRVTAEYMLAGLAVIASDTGANPELIQDNENGMLYAYQNSHELADKITIIVRTPKLIETYGKKARNDAVTKFNIKRYVDEIYKVYQEVIQTN